MKCSTHPTAASSQDATRSEGAAAYSIRAWGGRTLEQDECKSLSHMGILMPLILLPILYKGTPNSRCLYCILMPLFLWAFRSIPVPLAAFLHIVNLPLFGIMAPDQLAQHYFSMEGIKVALLSMLVTAVDSGTNLAPRVAYNVAWSYGLRRRRLFFILCGAAFVSGMLCSLTVVAVPLLLFVDRVVCTVYHENLDSVSGAAPVTTPKNQHTPLACSSRSAQSPASDILLHKLAQVVDAMKEEQKGKEAWKHDTDLSDEDGKDDREGQRGLRPKSSQPGQETPLKLSRKDSERDSKQKANGKKTTAGHGKVSESRTPDATVTKNPPAKAKSSPRFLNDEAATDLDRGSKRHLDEKRRDSQVPAPAHGATAAKTQPRRASILKPVGSSSFGSRRTSSGVDFKEGSVLFGAGSPQTPSPESEARTGRLLSERRPSRHSSLGSAVSERDSVSEWARWNTRQYARRISLRYPMGKDNVPEDWLARHGSTRQGSSTGATSGGQDAKAEAAAKDQVIRHRADMHNAFLLGPSVMAVLGNLSSVWSIPVGDAFQSLRQDPQLAKLTPLRWWLLTLPGSLVASLFSCFYIYSCFHIAKREPEEDSVQKDSIMRAAQSKLKELGPATIVSEMGRCYVCLFCMLYYPLVIMGYDATEMQLCILAGMVFVSSMLNRFFEHPILCRNNIGLKMPWGVLLILGAAQIISVAVENHNLIGELFSSIQSSFWQAYSPVYVQGMLAGISASLAEGMDRTTLSQLMMPIVNDIAVNTGVYPIYYAIPVVVGASTNIIMPISVPLIILHEIGHVPMRTLFLMGILVKAVVVGSVLITTNTASHLFYSGGMSQAPEK